MRVIFQETKAERYRLISASRSMGHGICFAIHTTEDALHLTPNGNRVFAVDLKLKSGRAQKPLPDGVMPSCDRDRLQNILDMKTALVEMFGASAFAIARGQPKGNDVGGNSGISWQELADSLRIK